MPEIVTMGELLIDFTPFTAENAPEAFMQNAGGAPANVAVQASILGAKTGFIGKVGEDRFGHFLKENLEKYHVDTSGLIFDSSVHTTLAFIHLGSKGERSFSFYRSPGADTQLTEAEIRFKLIDSCQLFHFGSISLTCDPVKTATLSALKYAKENKKIITYDPNYRAQLWESPSAAKTAMRSVLSDVDIIKVSEDELKMLTDCDQFLQGIAKLLHAGIKIAVVTQGAKGCIVAGNGGIERLPTYDVKTVDTTGSGDSFFGAFLYKVAQSGKEPQDISFAELKEFADFANACGAMCSTRKGAIPAMPTLEEVVSCTENVSKLK